jgi:hypothetical protein
MQRRHDRRPERNAGSSGCRPHPHIGGRAGSATAAGPFARALVVLLLIAVIVGYVL